MRITHIEILPNKKGFMVTVEVTLWRWLGTRTETRKYFTERGTFFYDENGQQPELMAQCDLDRQFNARVDWLERKFWDYDTHPSDSMKAHRRHTEAAAKARQLLNPPARS